jgi:membrane-associated phospholipid phosphatase
MTASERTEQPSPEERAQAEPAKEALREALKAIKTPEQAERAADIALGAAGAATEHEVRQEQPAAPEPAQAIQAAAHEPGAAKAPATLVEAAKQVAVTDGPKRAALEEALQEAANPEVKGETDPATAEGRDLLREAILRRMRSYQKADTRLFLAINGMPHPPWLNRTMVGLTDVMNAGFGWVLLLLIFKIVGGRRGKHALYQVLPPLWFATMSVEFPIKHYFRRQRPFYDIVQAIAVGKKPGGYSFPSGHSAAAFAGAMLMSRQFPRLWPLWYLIAALTGFSRIYLGAHYPGDVLSGALTGTAIAEVTRRVIDAGDDT